MNEIVLTVAGLVAHYGNSQVLFGINLEIREGQCLALLGRNGAGKETTMKANTGIQPGKSGDIFFNGSDILRRKSERFASAHLAFGPDTRTAITRQTDEETE